MAAKAAASIFPSPSSDSDSSGNISGKINRTTPSSVDIRFQSISATSGRMQVKQNAQAPSKVNGINVGIMDSSMIDDETIAYSPPRTCINQLPDLSMLLAAITTIFLAAEKQFMMLDSKPKRPDMLIDPLGSLVENGSIFRQNFSIRSYEISADRTASIETLMNHLQETALNHVRSAGILANGFGSTPEMCKRNLLWVVSKMQVLVDRYPQWGDVIRVDTWVAAAGKNGMRRDWLVQDSITGEILLRATSVWVMMNKETRKLSKIPDEVREEICGYFVDSLPIIEDDERKLPKLDEHNADYIRSGLSPSWNDLDLNRHVNNVKYIGWILESVPSSILENHELAGLTMEYRRECMRDSIVQSLTWILKKDNENSGSLPECQHLLRLEDGGDIVKGRTRWRPKSGGKLHPQSPSEDLSASR